MNRRKLLVSAAMAIGVAAGGGYYVAKIRPIETAKTAVREQLKDPNSALFGEVVLGRGGGACGLVNAKNSMGGYVGMQRFILSPAGLVEFEPRDSGGSSTSDQIASLQAQIAFAERGIEVCGDGKPAKAAASAPG